MIKRKDYNTLIERVKIYAKENPSGYKRRVLSLGILGYAYIFLILSLLIALIIAIIWGMFHVHSGQGGLFKLLIFFGILAWLIFKSLWVKTEAPQGYPLDKQKAPKLFAMINDICLRQQSPKPDIVLLNSDFNAFVSQVPRLGILGWYKNYLVLGLPYIMASDLSQFKAVIAHEFGHFSGSHGRAGTWIYRVRASWDNIMMNFEQQAGNFLFKWFFNWYVPYFNAYSFVLAREQEYEADRFANSYAGAKANAEELVNSLIKNYATGPYWASVWRQVNDHPQPPRDVFSKAVEQLKVPILEDQYLAHLHRALKFRTQNNDTHPCLKERLAAFGYKSEDGRIVDHQGNPLTCQRTVTASAAEELLDGQLIREVLHQFDEEWFQSIEGEWKERHKQAQNMKKEILQLNAKAQTTALSEEEFTKRAYLIDQTGSPQEALGALHEVLQRHPRNASAHYRLGELLLQEYDGRGIEHLKKAIEIDSSFTSAGLEKISWYHESKGEYEKVESALENLDKSSENDQKDYLERNNVTVRDQFKQHGLPEEIVSDLCNQLKPFEKELKQVYLVQKELKIYPQEPMYVIIVNGRVQGFQWSAGDFNQKLANKLVQAVQLNILQATTFFLVGDPAVIKKIRKIPAALIFKK